MVTLTHGGAARAARWRLHGSIRSALRAVGPPLLFGLGLWASVCFALYVTFWLQLDNGFWAGTSARSSANRVSARRFGRAGTGWPAARRGLAGLSTAAGTASGRTARR